MGIHAHHRPQHFPEAPKNKGAGCKETDREKIHYSKSKGGDTMKERIKKAVAAVREWLELQAAGWRAVNYGNEI